MKWLAVIVLLFYALPPVGYSAEDQAIFNPPDPVIQEFVRLVNAKRRSVGCAELKWDSKVAAIAWGHSADMASRHFFSHTNPDGKGHFERLRESRLDFSAAAENIALGPKTAREAFDTWVGSAGHRKNMLDGRFTRHGVARVEDTWTHVLIRP
ncbi:MAG TPA: CAP domain-containing protein [Thermodesulfobacteriota bacterium]|nr:CAP domain-containing protein [Thermodesulfobacteriota bacterium]